MSTSPSLSPEQQDTLLFLNGIFTSISLCGDLFVLFTYMTAAPTQKSFSMNLVMGLIFSSLLYSIGNMLSFWGDSASVCQFEGFLRQFSFASMMLWVLTISYLAYKMLKNYDDTLRDRYWGIVARNYILSLLLAAAPFTVGALGDSDVRYGRANEICSLEPYTLNIYLNGSLIVGSSVLIMVFSFMATALIRHHRRQNIKVKYMKILLYPMILFICWFPVVLEELFRLHLNRVVYWLMIWHIVSVRSLGLINALFFGRSTWQAFKKKFLSRKDSKESEGLEMSINRTRIETRSDDESTLEMSIVEPGRQVQSQTLRNSIANLNVQFGNEKVLPNDFDIEN